MTLEQRLSNSQKWWIFVKERFPIPTNGVMVLAFTSGNLAIASYDSFFSYQTLLVLLLCFSFFLRLRLFDELKDYETDLEINPTRPLARGLLSRKTVKQGFMILTIFEIILAAFLDITLVHGIAVAYSYVMYKEFFCGKFLSQHLTTYAVTHTFVSTLLGFSIVNITDNIELRTFPHYIISLGLFNWCMFNLFEFARKTYATSEERKNVNTYSSQFKPIGAILLSLSQVGIAGLTVWNYWMLSTVGIVLLSLQVLVCLPYLIKDSPSTAKLFRNTTGLFLILFYVEKTLLL